VAKLSGEYYIPGKAKLGVSFSTYNDYSVSPSRPSR
jgi:hypothetical protein